jgi:Icc-related predicted phosphoesterase
MRVAAIYDIHGNLPALEAVLADIAREGGDRIVVGGDVLCGPMTADVMDRLLTLEPPADFIQGNAEASVHGLSPRPRNSPTNTSSTRRRRRR